MPEIHSQLRLKFTGLIKVMCSDMFAFLPAVMENRNNYELPQMAFRENLLNLGWKSTAEAKASIVIITFCLSVGTCQFTFYS